MGRIDWQNGRVDYGGGSSGRVNWGTPTNTPQPNPPKESVWKKIGRVFSKTDDVAQTFLQNTGRVFGSAIGGLFGGALESARQVRDRETPLNERAHNVIETAKRIGKETGAAGARIFGSPVEIGREIYKTGKATAKGITGDQEAFFNRATEVLLRQGQLGQAVTGGRPFTEEEARDALLSGDKRAWASAIGGMGLDLAAVTPMINSIVRSSATRFRVPLERPTGRFADVPSTEFARRAGIKTETAPPGVVRVTEMERTPLARATEPVQRFFQKAAPPRGEFNPVPKLAGRETPIDLPAHPIMSPIEAAPVYSGISAPILQTLPASTRGFIMREVDAGKPIEAVTASVVEKLRTARESLLDVIGSLRERVNKKEFINQGDPDVAQLQRAQEVYQKVDTGLKKVDEGTFELADLSDISLDNPLFTPEKGKLLPEPQLSTKVQKQITDLTNKVDTLTKDQAQTQLTKIVETFRKEAGFIADQAGAGVRMSKVTDAVGNVDFIANRFKLNRAKSDMARRATDMVSYADNLLYDNSPEYRALVKRVSQLEDTQSALEVKNKIEDINFDEPRVRQKDVVLGGRIAFTFKELDNMWQKAIGDRLWSGLVKLSKKAVKKIGSGNTPAARWFRRMVAPKEFQGEGYVQLKEMFDVESQKAVQRALDMGNRLAELPEEAQFEVVDRIVEGRYDDTPIGKLAEEVESVFMELGQELVDHGKLKEETFLKNYGRYFPRLYEKYEREQIQNAFNKLKGVKADLSYIKKRKDLPPEVREALGEIKTAPYPVAKRLLQEGVDIAKLKFFDRVAENENFASVRGKEGFKQLPETKRLGALSEKFVPEEIYYDLVELSQAEPMSTLGKMVENANRIWKGTHTILDTGVITSNMVSNIVLSDFAGLPPQRVDVWGKAFFDTLKKKGSYTAMTDMGKFRHTFTRNELQSFLPEIDKFQKLKNLKEIKTLSDVAGLMAHAIRKGWVGAGEAYGFLEEWSKTAVYKYLHEERGWASKEAADHAEKWLFNYGDVPPVINWIRRRGSIIGQPFITFAFKSVPRFIESTIRMPFTWGKYIIALNLLGGGAMMLKKLGLTEEEFRKIKPKSAGDWLIYIGRNEDGTHEFADLSRYFPFGRILNPRKPFDLKRIGSNTGKQLLPSGQFGVMKAGLVGLALLNNQTYRDGFFDEIIFNEPTKMDQSERYYKALNYLFADWTPNWFPSITGDSYKAVDYLRKGLKDQQTTIKGVPQRYTVPEALLRFIGTKKVEMHPTLLRTFEGGDIDQKIREKKATARRSVSNQEKQKIDEEIKKLQEQRSNLFKAIGKLEGAKN